jgi:hypothetical protein
MPISYGTPSDPDASVGACVVNRDWDVPDGTATDKDAVAVERALDEAVMIAVPDVVGMSWSWPLRGSAIRARRD